MASGAIFIAINTLTFVTLNPKLKTEGFALYYTILFTGSVIGIAVIVTILTRMSQVANTVVGAHINPYNERFRYLVLPDTWNIDELAGLRTLEELVHTQAEMIAYSDAFLAAALISLIGLPLAFLFTPPKRKI